MEKSQINSLKMQWFFNDSFQKKWQNYKTAFGEDLDGLFADDYDKKLRLSSGLEHLINNRLLTPITNCGILNPLAQPIPRERFYADCFRYVRTKRKWQGLRSEIG